MPNQTAVLGEVISRDQEWLLNEWIERQLSSMGSRKEHAGAAQIRPY